VSSAAQTALTAALGAGLLVAAVILVRRGLLSVRYGLGWMVVGIGVLVLAALLEPLERLADWLGVSPTGFVLGLVVLVLGLVCLQLSISISGLHAAVQDLSERSALLEQRLRGFEDVEVQAVDQPRSSSREPDTGVPPTLTGRR
jgi:hypothetical protein